MANIHGGGIDPPGGSGQGSSHGSPNEKAFDPYYRYAEATHFRFVRGNKVNAVPVLLELAVPLGKLLDHDGSFLPDPLAKFIQISTLYTEAPPPLLETRFVSALVLPEFFKALAEGQLAHAIVRFEYCAPLNNRDAWPAKPVRSKKSSPGGAKGMNTPAQSPQTGPTGPSSGSPPVLVGIIDDAIAFAHQRFRDASGAYTRLHAFWAQGDDQTGPGIPGWSPSDGRVLDRTQINGLLQQATTSGVLDEDAFYALAGNSYVGAGHKGWGRRAGHGTHVMDIAAGMTPAAVGSSTPIIAAVQLPVAVTADSSGVLLTSFALDALWWIAINAWVLGHERGMTALPCVINMSYGTLAGPHDSTDPLAQAIDFLVGIWGNLPGSPRLSVVIPAGNGYLSQCHAHDRLPANRVRDVPFRWRILPDCATPSFAEVWLPSNTGFGQVEVQVTSPEGHRSPWVKESGPEYPWPPQAAPLLRIAFHSPAIGGRKQILIAVYPTVPPDIGDPIAPSGVWTITLRNMGGKVLPVDLWIRRNDTPFGYPIRGRQSRLEDTHYLETRYDVYGRQVEVDDGLSQVVRAGSLNGLATGALAVVVGGCRAGDLSAARYSAAGTDPASPATAQTVRHPDALALSDASHVRAGILAAGTRSGSVCTMNGTSVAAPQVTRWIARALAAGKPGTRLNVEDEANTEEVNRAGSIEPAGPFKKRPEKFRGGHGRIVIPDLPPANKLR
jgi:hypothetical protein